MRQLFLISISISFTLVLAVAASRVFRIGFFEAAALVALIDGAILRIISAQSKSLGKIHAQLSKACRDLADRNIEVSKQYLALANKYEKSLEEKLRGGPYKTPYEKKDSN